MFGAVRAGRSPATETFVGYLLGGGVMVIGGIIEIIFGVRAERKSLETIARPLSAAIPDTAVPRAAGATSTFSPRHLE
jgi:hypothetical protein